MDNTISHTICIDTEKLTDIRDIENKLKKEISKTYRELMVEILSKKEEQILKNKNYIKKGKVSRYLYSQFGQIIYTRYKAKDSSGIYFYPLDRQLKIEKGSSFSPNVQKRAVYLATLYPYRQARDILSYEIGCHIDHRALWRLVQKKGIKLRGMAEDEVESLFSYAKQVEGDGISREIVVIEADGTGISSQEGKGRWMEAKIGIIYTGKKLTSSTSKIKRYALEDKTVYADIVDSDTFGKNMSILCEKKYAVSHAKNILLLSDGDKWIKNYQVSYLPGSVHQLDHYHLKKKFRQAYSHFPYLLDKALNLINTKKAYKLPQFIRLSKDNGAIEEAAADELISYIETNIDDIWGIDSLAGKVPKEVLVVGSGAIEKNVDIVIARRFKMRGMSWSSEGARNLMAFRIMHANGTFDSYFDVAA